MTPYTSARERYDAGDLVGAERLCRQAQVADRDAAWTWRLLGLICHRKGQRESACQHLRQAIDLDPGDAENHLHGAEIFRQAGRLQEAERAAKTAASLRPDAPAALNNLGLVLQDAGRFEEAEATFARAAQLSPDYARAHLNLGCLLLRQNRLSEAALALQAALSSQPDYAQALNAMGETLRRMGRPDTALVHLQRAIGLKADYLPALLNGANALADLEQFDKAQAALQRAVALDPAYAAAHHDLGALHEHRRDWLAALKSYEKAAALKPDNLAYQFDLENARRYACDWSGFSDNVPRVIAACRERADREEPPPVGPFVSLRFPTSNADRLSIARQFSRQVARATDARFASRHREKLCGFDSRLRLGFLSHQFNTSVYGHLTQGLYERFDRRLFEVIALDYSRPDDSDFRRRILAGCDGFIELRGLTPVQMAQRIADAGIHILVDLDSYLAGGLPEVIAWRPAPVQVSYLYPATTGAAAFDYLIVDPVVAPAGMDEFFTEKLVRIPAPYMVSTGPPTSALSARPDRRAWGLPDDGFVFCSFNAPDKIDPPTFDAWMRILGRVPQSVLWLLCEEPLARQNLCREARLRGTEPARLVLASRAAIDMHSARMQCADLFLDTLNHGAHATAIDTLAAGLPLLTCPGPTMASRVGASLLSALELPELIANDIDAFERKAIHLAHDPDSMQSLRGKLAERSCRGAIFNPTSLVRHLEHAFREMWRRYLTRAAAAPISIPTPNVSI